MKKVTWLLTLSITLMLVSCSFAEMSMADAPQKTDESPEMQFIGKWLSLQSAKDSVQTHLEFKEQGRGVELVTKGDSVISTYPFLYSFNNERVTFEASYVTLSGAYPYRFDKDTMFLGNLKYLKW